MKKWFQNLPYFFLCGNLLAQVPLQNSENEAEKRIFPQIELDVKSIRELYQNKEREKFPLLKGSDEKSLKQMLERRGYFESDQSSQMQLDPESLKKIFQSQYPQGIQKTSAAETIEPRTEAEKMIFQPKGSVWESPKNEFDLNPQIPFQQPAINSGLSPQGTPSTSAGKVLKLQALTVEAIVIDPGEPPLTEKPNRNRRYIRGATQFDSRIELRSLNPSEPWQLEILKNAQAVGMIVEKNRLHAITDSIFQLDIGTTLTERFSLCPNEPFGEQPIIGLGTAFIIGDQTMMTAGHVFQGELRDYVVVFGFELTNKAGEFQRLILAKDIYTPSSIVYQDQDLDLLAFKVSRPLDRRILKLALKSSFPRNMPVYMIGHPSGLPKKVALNASVQDQEDPRNFYTTLDSFQGNSGSPVFELETNEVIGVLVSGMVDYQWNGTCNYSSICNIPYCKGEKVTSLWALSDFFQQMSDR